MDPKMEFDIVLFFGYIMVIIVKNLIMRLVNKQKEKNKKE